VPDLEWNAKIAVREEGVFLVYTGTHWNTKLWKTSLLPKALNQNFMVRGAIVGVRLCSISPRSHTPILIGQLMPL
jgi:hypothetical protein